MSKQCLSYLKPWGRVATAIAIPLFHLGSALPLGAVPTQPESNQPFTESLQSPALPLPQPPTLDPSIHHLAPQLFRLVTATAPDLPDLGNAEQFLPSPSPDLRLVIRLSDRRVYVYYGDEIQTSYPIAIGREGWETPTGEYEVLQKIQDPAWQHPFTGEIVPPGASNPLGNRWIGFWTDGTNYIGFHGTPNEESVGRPASHGCIRMYNRDVVALFDMVDVGTPVSVVP